MLKSTRRNAGGSFICGGIPSLRGSGAQMLFFVFKAVFCCVPFVRTLQAANRRPESASNFHSRLSYHKRKVRQFSKTEETGKKLKYQHGRASPFPEQMNTRPEAVLTTVEARGQGKCPNT
ncbi:hypothetical protein L596_001499 [Steinernema carpocapsae]|uniref:Uncharacterized protein n=1 Tax=Steinernema carpocapsae TaxID=34508 RepID=A0A4U8ULE9_STECR|nr:hypothetical protein L596_001499 [Steinernema carpocapsae]